MDLLAKIDPPDSPVPAQPPGTVALPGDYEMVWMANSGDREGHWVMKRTATVGSRVRTTEATRADADDLHPAYIDQEMARLFVQMQQINTQQAKQLAQITGQLRQMQAQAEVTARQVLVLTGKLAEAQLQLQKARAQSAEQQPQQAASK